MGWLSKAFGSVARIAGSILGFAPTKAVAAAVPSVATRSLSAIRRAAPIVGQAALAGGVGALGAGLVGPDGQALPVGGPGQLGGGNGRFAKQTIVQTIDLTTGQVVRQVTMNGAPWLMNSEVSGLGRVSRKVRKASRKIPTRTRRQSLGEELKEAAIEKAIALTKA